MGGLWMCRGDGGHWRVRTEAREVLAYERAKLAASTPQRRGAAPRLAGSLPQNPPGYPPDPQKRYLLGKKLVSFGIPLPSFRQIHDKS